MKQKKRAKKKSKTFKFCWNCNQNVINAQNIDTSVLKGCKTHLPKTKIAKIFYLGLTSPRLHQVNIISEIQNHDMAKTLL